MIRVLVVDDSPVMQYLLRLILESDPELQVIGVAADGEQAIRMTKALRPDIITMDVRMPKLHGLEATKCIMQECPTPIVIVSASADVPELNIAYNALEAGALTLVEKPSLADSRECTDPIMGKFGAELINTVKLMSEVKVVTQLRPRIHQSNLGTLPSTQSDQRIFAIAASTGGPAALNNILGHLPQDFPNPILIVQHIAKGFLEGLALWLNLASKVKVKIARNDDQLQNQTAYLCPNDVHMELGKDRRINFSEAAAVGGFKPSATVLFNSLAKNHARHTVGIILTGMGRDGADGLKAIKTAGGITIAQDEQSCIVFGMPKEAINCGAAGFVVALGDIPLYMARFINN